MLITLLTLSIELVELRFSKPEVSGTEAGVSRPYPRGTVMAGSQIRYLLDTSRFEFEVVKTAVAKVDNEGVQKRDFVTKLPVWVVEVPAYMGEDEGAQQMSIAVASEVKPDLRWRQPVELVELEMIPWSSKGRSDRDPIRSGVAFRALEIRPVGAAQLRAA
jgi:hypothetical protein